MKTFQHATMLKFVFIRSVHNYLELITVGSKIQFFVVTSTIKPAEIRSFIPIKDDKEYIIIDILKLFTIIHYFLLYIYIYFKHLNSFNIHCPSSYVTMFYTYRRINFIYISVV